MSFHLLISLISYEILLPFETIGYPFTEIELIHKPISTNSKYTAIQIECPHNSTFMSLKSYDIIVLYMVNTNHLNRIIFKS